MAEDTVVLLANDKISTNLLTLLESFRHYNPDTKVKIIPYNDDVDTVRDMSKFYNCDMIDSDYSYLDNLAKDLFPSEEYRRTRLRKLKVFDVDSPCIYIDCDVIVNNSFNDIFRFMREQSRLLVYASESRDFVYNERAMAEQPELARRALFSSGFMGFCKLGFNTSDAAALIRQNFDEILSIRADRVFDQPLFNYVCRKMEISLLDLYQIEGVSGLNHSDHSNLALENGRFIDIKSLHRSVVFVHWAGTEGMSGEVRFGEFRDTWLEKGQKRTNKF